MKNSRIIEIAMALKPIDWGKHPFHLTFAFKKNKLLCIGQNNPKKTSPRNLKYNHIDRNGKSKSHVIGIHSELSAVIKLSTENCSDISFYVVRIDNAGNANYSKPCSGCMDMFQQVGYKEVYFTDKKGEFKRLNNQ